MRCHQRGLCFCATHHSHDRAAILNEGWDLVDLLYISPCCINIAVDAWDQPTWLPVTKCVAILCGYVSDSLTRNNITYVNNYTEHHAVGQWKLLIAFHG